MDASHDKTLSETYGRLNDLVNEFVPNAVERLSDDREGLLTLLKLHRELVKLLRQADTVIESELLKHHFDFGGEEIEGVGFVRVHKTGKKTRYDNDAVISRLASAMVDYVALPDPETGAYESVPVIVARTVNEMADLVGARTMSFDNWRKTPAKAMGIPIEKYATTEGGTLSIKIEDR